jgi:hypothetical protein
MKTVNGLYWQALRTVIEDERVGNAMVYTDVLSLRNFGDVANFRRKSPKFRRNRRFAIASVTGLSLTVSLRVRPVPGGFFVTVIEVQSSRTLRNFPTIA